MAFFKPEGKLISAKKFFSLNAKHFKFTTSTNLVILINLLNFYHILDTVG